MAAVVSENREKLAENPCILAIWKRVAMAHTQQNMLYFNLEEAYLSREAYLSLKL